MKRIFTLLIIAILFVISSFAQSGTCGDNLTWQLTPDGVLTISGTGAMFDYTSTTQPWNSYKTTIKMVVIKDGVTLIGDYAFYNCSSLTSITIPNSITSIGNMAFYGCSNITKVHISDITKWCDINFDKNTSNPLFSNSKITYLYLNNNKIIDLVIPEGVDSIKNYAFLNYELLHSVIIPNGVTSIGSSAFAGCKNLTTMTIPSSVTLIGDGAFSGCSSLTSINVNENNLNYTSIDGALYNKDITTLITCPIAKIDVTIPSSVISIGDRAFVGCSSLTSINVNENNLKYTSIDGVLYNKDITTLITCPRGKSEVTIPNRVTSIGDNAFEYCVSLTSIIIPNSVTSIGERAFQYCSSLTSLIMESAIPPTLGSSAIQKSTLIYIPDGAKSTYQKEWGTNYFYLNNETTLAVNVETPGTLSDLILAIGQQSTDVVKLVVSGTLNDDDFTYMRETMTSLTILDISKITNTTGVNFRGKRTLVNISLPENLTSIGNFAFSGCSNLTSIIIPNSVTSIGSSAFSGCSNITEVHIFDIAKWCDIEFSGYLSNPLQSKIAHLYVNNNKITDLVIPEGVDSIKNYAFYFYALLNSVTIPNSVTLIGSSAFSGCSNLTSIIIPNSVTSIGSSAFSGCSNITEVHIFDIAKWCDIEFSGYLSNPLQSKIAHLYVNNNKITDLVIPEGVDSIKNYAFYGYALLNSVTIPNSVTLIGDYAFYDCSSFISITIPNGVTSIGGYAFRGCSSLTSIIIPNSVISINLDGMFWGCSSLTSVIIPSSVTSIGLSAFSGCLSLTSITIPNSVTSIVFDAFDNCSSLTSISIESIIPPSIISPFDTCNLFDKVSKAIPITIPCGTLEAYQSAQYWNEFTNFVENSTFPFDLSVNINDSTMGGVEITKQPTCTDNTSTLTATPNDGYRFVKWSDDNAENPRTITVTEDIILTAEFENNIIASGTCGDNLTWELTPDSVLTISGTGAMYGYTSTSQPWSSYRSTIKSVVIEDGVTSIGDMAFYLCSSLTSITIPNSVTLIGSSAFSGCSNITEVHISDIAKWCDIEFSGYLSNPLQSKIAHLYVNNNKITDLVIPEGVDSIKNYAFYFYALLNSVTIPNSVTLIGSSAFSGCSNLTSIIIPNSVTLIGSSAFSGCSNITEVHISDIAKWCDINFSSATSNPLYSQKAYLYVNNNKITNLVIPEGVDSIKKFAFYNYALLNSITIPNSVTLIGSSAFLGCSNIKEVHISDIVKWCGINFSSTTSNPLYGQKAYLYVNNNKITDLVIPEGVDSIKNYAFYGYALLNSVTIPNSVTSIGDDAFVHCSSLTSITIPNGVTSIGNGAFSHCTSLTSITLPNSVTSIGGFTFYGCSALTSIIIPNNVTSIRILTFSKCIGLTTIIIPNSVTLIRSGAFSGCSSLTSMTLESTTPPTIESSSIFDNVSKTIPVTVPCGSIEAYQSAKYWNEFTNFVESGFPFEVSVSVNDTTMGNAEITNQDCANNEFTLTATPSEGYRFTQWSDRNTENPRTIAVTQDTIITAEFEKLPLEFYVSVMSNDTIKGMVMFTKGTNNAECEEGSVVSFVAITNSGYSFKGWSDGEKDALRTVVVTQDTAIVAQFESLFVNWIPDVNTDEHTFLGKQYYDTISVAPNKNIYVEDGATIACNDIVIKADGNGNVPEIKIEGDIIANNGITFEWEIDDSRWYFFTLPFNCKISDIEIVTIANGPSDGVWNYYNPQDGSGDFIIRDYNQKHVAQGQGEKTGWVDCEANKMLHKGRGYIIALFPAGSKAKVQFKSEKQIQLSKFIEHELDFGEEHSWYDYAEGDNQLYNGWNLIGVPYFETFSQGDLDATYVSIPNNDGTTYTQHTLAEALTQGLLRPFLSFFIQLAENVAPTFDPTDRSNAPMLRAKQNAEGGEIVVNILKAENKELCDKTTIINNTSKTNDYEIGYDLQKMIGYAAKPQIYTIEECGILAFNAQDVMASCIIRLGFYIPADGEYVIGGESWGKLSGAELYDNETGLATVLTIPQTIYFTKGTYNERFEIRVKQQTMTDVDVVDNDYNVYIENGCLIVKNMPQNGNVYVYDSAGKLIHEQTTNSEVNLNLVVEGVYNITICTEDNRVFNTKVVY